MSDEYKMVLSMGGHEIVVSGPDPDWVKGRFVEIFKDSVEPAKRIPAGFSARDLFMERSYE